MSSPFRAAHPGFVVWNPDGRYPRVTHDRVEDATTESLRLARENPGLSFYVLAPIGMAYVPRAQPDFFAMKPLDINDADRAAIRDREIPF